ncbi:GNAT family N-acetyltransferase [Thalassotalea ponticola]|uniref:GNAT family N-acetyltransferase n=1 Tax=Thalassotalea ponticola TaxID=1523392 RepID=UPI0025B44343|nr:GNAT family N-acetyltransferase [Thalassotalea ponticola]MDN3652037.1 GNAT family N-acetyltransferase [Thalassotalea ponticola]
MKQDIIYRAMQTADFDAVIELGNRIHGHGYVNAQQMKQWFEQGIKDGINANYVAYHGDKLVGFRITFAAQQFTLDKWYTPTAWRTPIEQTAYFKCNSVDENYQRCGIGSTLLKRAVQALQAQGAKAGVSHLWRQSPGNSAVEYFTKCDGQLVKDHPGKWNEDSKNGYTCTICANDCHCVAAEMIIYFDSAHQQ